ncbi:hypothetical protein D7Y13_40250 [Corallococcus praedator]|uniref:Uncharacterized protein n=2 Tax=Corallococcus praedator TaxID=2316724 RepID=A0ABX9Q569_9BACT|nr:MULTISPECIES: hypothetical protein [Corallococcus]RKH18492.1 hypothetical protein D7X75_39515 [Corallococcus sp. CA031C]RKH89939.1 hypothetical protein D7Y13_40250 [Corallococcus praedator]
MAPSLFDDYVDVPNVETGPDFDAADDRTLRMASQPVDKALLDSLIRYQETFLSHVESDAAPEAMARAQTAALTDSGLTLKTVEWGLSVLRAFGGRRWTAQRLQSKLTELEATSGAEVDALRQRIQTELKKQERHTEALGRRYGPDTVVLLREHEPVLVALHTRLTKVLSRG